MSEAQQAVETTTTPATTTSPATNSPDADARLATVDATGEGQPAGTDEESGSDVDWGGFAKDENEGDEVDGDAEETLVTAAPTPISSPSQTPVAAVAPPEPQPTPTPIPTQPSVSADELQRQAVERRNSVLAELAKQYGISAEDAPRLITEPEVVLPQMFAKLHADVQEQTLNAIAQRFPDMLLQHNENTRRIEQGKNAFFSAWPELNKPELGPTVARVLTGYRQANPDADQETIIREGGLLSFAALKMGIPQRVIETKTTLTNEQPAAYSAEQNPGRIPVTTPKLTNPFEIIAVEDVQEGVRH